MAKSFNQIKNELVRGVRVKRRRTKTPVIVAMVGAIGSGKSTIARMLGKILDWSLVDKNRIRVKLRQVGRGFTPKTTDHIARAVLIKIIKGRGNAIIDSDSIEKSKRKNLERFARRCGARILYIHTLCDWDIMLGRLLKAKYDPARHIFKDAAVALREHCRRLPWHYRWSEARGGFYTPRRLPIKFFAEINTTNPDKWKKKVRLIAKRLRRL